MPRLSRIVPHVTSFLILLFFLVSCTQPTPIPLSSRSSLIAFSNSSLIEFNADFQPARELPLNLPCPLSALHASPVGTYLALELECENGPLVQVLDAAGGEVTTPFPAVDSHFLAWDLDNGLYLRVDALGNTRIVRVVPNGPSGQFPLSAQTYDMDVAPDNASLIYTFTRGLGQGSELWAATATADRTWQLAADPDSIITFARWSPDGRQIAFIAMPDTATPFPPGKLWVMDANGRNKRLLANVDAGHGYAPAWSPDSTRLAYVLRENPNDPAADQSADALVSNIYMIDVASRAVTQVTRFDGALVEAPLWSADGHYLAFAVVHGLDDTITVWIADLDSGQVTQLAGPGPLRSPAWMRK
jgi:Tol biopolymer transport system component